MKENRGWIKKIYSRKTIYVKIVGNIKNPGVYMMFDGEELKDLLEKAGGSVYSVSEDTNLNSVLTDGQVIEIKH